MSFTSILVFVFELLPYFKYMEDVILKPSMQTLLKKYVLSYFLIPTMCVLACVEDDVFKGCMTATFYVINFSFVIFYLLDALNEQ